MIEQRAAAERGFTLVEVVVAVAVIAAAVLAGVGVTLGSRSFAVAAAASEFDHMLETARTIARQTQGVTLTFAPDAYGDGTEVRILTAAPDGTLTATTAPIFHTRAVIEETESLGKAPFAFVVHASGSLGGRPGFRRGTTPIAPEVGCPARGSFHFTIHTAGTTADRYIPCRITLAATGPLALTSWPPATIAPLPTPCAGGCTPAPLPTPPTTTATCPPNFTAIPGGCTPASGFTAPRYHVTANVASPSMLVGSTDTITAQAILTNPDTAPPGVPVTVPVIAQVLQNGVCTAIPQSSQQSGSSFTLNGIAAGICSSTIQADYSSVANATADSQSADVLVITAKPPSPPQQCDLTQNDGCYRRILERTAAKFWKYVTPSTACTTDSGTQSCIYLNSIQQIGLGPSYTVRPPIPADNDHALIFQIDWVAGVELQCQPYSFFQGLTTDTAIYWGDTFIGAPIQSPDGFGEPSRFFSINYVGASGQLPNSAVQTWAQDTRLMQLFNSVMTHTIGETQMFAYSTTDGALSVDWVPDFPACDAYDSASDGSQRQYGNAAVTLVFEVFQRSP